MLATFGLAVHREARVSRTTGGGDVTEVDSGRIARGNRAFRSDGLRNSSILCTLGADRASVRIPEAYLPEASTASFRTYRGRRVLNPNLPCSPHSIPTVQHVQPSAISIIHLKNSFNPLPSSSLLYSRSNFLLPELSDY